MATSERDLHIGDRIIRLRDAGDPGGIAVLYFHGTPGSRLDTTWAERTAGRRHVRLISFDRPGYGGSTGAPFGLTDIAKDACRLADELDLTTFATLGLSGGGPFALATAATAPDRVAAVGVAAGPGPFGRVPGSIDRLDEGDLAALALLPAEPEAAAAQFGAGFEPMADLLREGDDKVVGAAFDSVMSARDKEISADPAFGPLAMAAMREGLRSGVTGGAWDNVAWVGPWDFDLATITCPVSLWYGEEDLIVPTSNGDWLHAHLPTSRLHVLTGLGHFALYDRLDDVLGALGAPRAE